jgi:hypothetical protein
MQQLRCHCHGVGSYEVDFHRRCQSCCVCCHRRRRRRCSFSVIYRDRVASASSRRWRRRWQRRVAQPRPALGGPPCCSGRRAALGASATARLSRGLPSSGGRCGERRRRSTLAAGATGRRPSHRRCSRDCGSSGGDGGGGNQASRNSTCHQNCPYAHALVAAKRRKQNNPSKRNQQASLSHALLRIIHGRARRPRRHRVRIVIAARERASAPGGKAQRLLPAPQLALVLGGQAQLLALVRRHHQ